MNILVDMASDSGDEDLGLIPSQVKPMILKLVFIDFSLDAQYRLQKGRCGDQTGKLTCCAVGNGTRRDYTIVGWLATPK